MAELPRAPRRNEAARSSRLRRPRPAGAALRVLTVVAGGRRFALDVECVRGIERPARWARLPWAPSYVRGVSEVGGEVVTVLSLARRLGLAEGPPRASEGVVLVESAEPVALAVEGVEGLSALGPEALRELGPAGQEAALRAAAPDGLLLLDAEALVDGRRLRPLGAFEPEGGAA